MLKINVYYAYGCYTSIICIWICNLILYQYMQIYVEALPTTLLTIYCMLNYSHENKVSQTCVIFTFILYTIADIILTLSYYVYDTLLYPSVMCYWFGHLIMMYVIIKSHKLSKKLLLYHLLTACPYLVTYVYTIYQISKYCSLSVLQLTGICIYLLTEYIIAWSCIYNPFEVHQLFVTFGYHVFIIADTCLIFGLYCLKPGIFETFYRVCTVLLYWIAITLISQIIPIRKTQMNKDLKISI